MQRRAAEESLTDHGKDNSNGRAHVGDVIRHKPGILGFLRQIGFMGATTGCQWRAIPKDLPPRSTLFGYFELWDDDGTLDRIHHSLYVKCREAIGREASPTACVIESHTN